VCRSISVGLGWLWLLTRRLELLLMTDCAGDVGRLLGHVLSMSCDGMGCERCVADIDGWMFDIYV